MVLFFFSVPILETRATSSPFYGIGLGSEGCDVAFSVDSLGKDCSSLKMVSEKGSSLEFEEARVIPIEIAEREHVNAQGSCPGLVSRVKVSIADPSSGNPKAFSDSFSSPTMGFSADILAHLKKLGARKELRGREDEKRKKLRLFCASVYNVNDEGEWEITAVDRRCLFCFL